MSTATIKLPNSSAVDADNPFPVTLQSKLMTDATGLNSRLRVDIVMDFTLITGEIKASIYS